MVISIGSLGREVQEDGVENVTVKSATFTNTQNGVRIKTWGKPSNGFARSVIFQDIVMVNVENPIIIDQNYCPDNKGCPGQVSMDFRFKKVFFFQCMFMQAI